MLRTKDKFWCTIPNRHDHFIPSKQPSLGERFVPQAGETEITDLDDASGRDEDVRGLQITMEDKAGVEKVHAGEELVEQSAEGGRGYRRPGGLGVMVDDLLPRVSVAFPCCRAVWARRGLVGWPDQERTGKDRTEHYTHKEVVLGVFKYHVDRLVFQYHLAEGDQIAVMQFPIELVLRQRILPSLR